MDRQHHAHNTHIESAPTPGNQAPGITQTAALGSRIRQSPGSLRVLSGDRPTGRLHLGHFFGTVRNRVRMQDLGVETSVFTADYRVLTDRDMAANQQETVEGLVLHQLALGIDPERSTIFTQSAVPALNQLMLPFLSLVSVPELRRNPTVKVEIAPSGQDAVSGLMFTYPVHKAADILLCTANLVPVGLDQLPTSSSPPPSPGGSTHAAATVAGSSRSPMPCCRKPRCCWARTEGR